MAGVFGVAASIIGVAGVAQQFASSVLKMKDFCKDVKNAPKELLDLVNRLESMSSLLTRIGNEDVTGMNGDVLHEALKLAEQAAERVSILAARLHGEMGRQRWRTSLRAAFKKKELTAMLTELAWSRGDLQLAFNLYSVARQRRDLQLYMEEARQERVQFLECTRIIPRPRGDAQDGNDADPEGAEESSRALARRKKLSRRPELWSKDIRIRMPIWLCQYAWDVSFVRASGSWTTSLKTFKIVSTDSDAYDICQCGDIHEIRGLLQRRELSIHDRFAQEPVEVSLFALAVYWGQTELVRMLYESGAATEYDSIEQSHHGTWAAIGLPWSRGVDHMAMHARFLLDHCDVQESPTLQALARSPSQWTIEDRLRVLFLQQNAPQKSFIKTMGEASIDPNLYRTSLKGRDSVLHLLAKRLSMAQRLERRGETAHVWERLIGEAARAGADLWDFNKYDQTPLQVFIFDSLAKPHDATFTLQVWIKTLYDAGMDLEQ